jgi:hypothetical protein
MRVLNITEQKFGASVDQDRAHDSSHNQRDPMTTQWSTFQTQACHVKRSETFRIRDSSPTTAGSE